MWTAWNNNAGDGDADDRRGAELFKRDLVLSWKQLNVTVTKKVPKLFGRSEVVREQILDNGKDGARLHKPTSVFRFGTSFRYAGDLRTGGLEFFKTARGDDYS